MQFYGFTFYEDRVKGPYYQQGGGAVTHRMLPDHILKGVHTSAFSFPRAFAAFIVVAKPFSSSLLK
jgi:hypothetical protein